MKYTLMSNRSRREIMALYFIIGKKETSLDFISQFLNISKRLAKETIIGINEHFIKYLKKDEFVTSTNFGVVSINVKYRDRGLSDINKLKLFLLKENQLFNLCLLLSTNASIKRSDILKKLYISEAYLDKITIQLRNFLISFGLNMDLSHGVFKLNGPEIYIRIFTFVFLFDSFQDVEWPFKNLSPSEIDNSFSDASLLNIKQKGNSEILALYYLISIFHLRTESGNIIDNYPSSGEKQFLSVFYNLTKSSEIGVHSILGSKLIDASVIESHYLVFLTCISTSDMLDPVAKSQIGDEFRKSEVSFPLVHKILDNNLFIISQNVSENLLSLVSYHLAVAIACSYILEDTTQNFLFLLSSFHPTYLDLDEVFIDSFRKSNANIEMGKNQLQIVSRLLYSIYNSNMQTNFLIYLQMTRDLSASFNIISRIENIFNIQNIGVTNNISDADVIVTDVFDGIGKAKKNVIYLDSINNRKAWNELLADILKMYIEKQDTERESYLKTLF